MDLIMLLLSFIFLSLILYLVNNLLRFNLSRVIKKVVIWKRKKLKRRS